MRRAYLDLKGGQLHYRYEGQGRPVVLIHMSGSSSDEFEAVSRSLKDSYSVYAPDLPGFGYSYKPERYLSIDGYAETVKEFMEALSLEDVILAGNLVGANVAAKTALLCPERIGRLFLVQFIYDEDYARFRSFRQSPAFSPVIPDPQGEYLGTLWKRASGAAWNTDGGLPAEIIHNRTICMMLAGDLSEAMHWAVFEDEDYKTLLPGLVPETTVVSLKAHSFGAIQQAVTDLIPGAKLIELEGADSYLSRTDPERYASVILQNS